MRKLLLALTCIAAMVFAVSCNKSIDSGVVVTGEEITATFEINSPDVAVTKAISDGSKATALTVAVYDEDGKYLSDLSLNANANISGSAPTWTVKVKLIAGFNYQFVFFAKCPTDNGFSTFAPDSAYLAINYSKLPANDDKADFFYAKENVAATGSLSKSVEMFRPLAQVNFGSGDLTDAAYLIHTEATGDDAMKTEVKLTGIYSGMNLLTGAVSGSASEITFGEAVRVAEDQAFVTGYDRIAMVYALVNKENQGLSQATLSVSAKSKATGATGTLDIERVIENVPLKRNYRTNILGNLFTGDAVFTVNTVPGFDNVAYGDEHVADYVPTFNTIDSINAKLASNVYALALDVPSATAIDGTIILPDTDADIYLYILNDHSAAGNVLNIQYADGAANKPANLYIYAKKLYELNGNLPNTHVVIDSYSYIDHGTLYVSNSTLVIKPYAYYGRLVMMQGSLLVEANAQIDTARIDKNVKILDAEKALADRAKVDVEENATVIKLVIEDLSGNATVKGNVQTVEVSRTADPGETTADIPTVNIEGTATVENLEQKKDANIDISEGAKVEEVIADDPSKIDDKSGEVEFLIMNEAQLTAAVETKLAKMKIGANFTITRGYTIDFSTDINLNGFTISADATNTSEFPNSRAFKFAGSDDITVKIHAGEIKLLDNKIYGPFRMENANASFVLDSLTLNNKMAYGLGIKIVSAKSLALSNTTINSVVGGCIEQGTNCPLTLTNCTFNQTELDTEHPWISAGVAVSYGGSLTVASGNYSAYRALYLYSSGGTINVTGGSFTGTDAVITVDNNTWEPGYAASSVINISDGTFDGPIFVSGWGAATPAPVAALNISGGTFNNSTNNTMFHASNGTISITGGSFSENPSAYVAYGYEAVYNEQTQYWTIQEKKVVWNQTTDVYYPSLESAMTAAANNDVLVVLRDCTVESQTDVTKSITINASNKKITNNSTGRICKVYGDVTVTLNGGEYIGNSTQLGFVDLRNSSGYATGKEKLIVNNASFTGVTNNGTFFGIRASGQEVTLNNVNCNVSGNVGSIVNGWNQECKLTITGGTYNYDSALTNYGVFQAGKFTTKSNNTEITLSGVTINTTSGPVIEGHGKVTIENCTFQDPQAEQSWVWCNSGIAAACGAEVSVANGTYTGNNAVFVYNTGGEINISGGSFTGSNDGNAIAIDNSTYNSSWQAPSVVNVTGGTFNGSLYLDAQGSASASSTLNISGGSFSAAAGQLFKVNGSQSHIAITGGTFSEDPSAYVPDTHIAVYNPTNHNYTVEPATWWEASAVDDAAWNALIDETNKTITISTAEQLAKFAKVINAHGEDFQYKGYTVKLDADIDLDGKLWTPIGVCADWTRGHFSGTFDGQGHTISNLRSIRYDRAGLFGSIYGEAVIKNVTLNDIEIIGNRMAGGIIGWINEENYDLIVDNCTVDGGSITLTPNFENNEWDNGDKAGGIVGYSNQNTADHCKITNNIAKNLTITAYRDFGGIVGYCSGNVSVTGNTAKDIVLVQDNFHGYKPSVTTVNAIVGRNDGSVQENNTIDNVTQKTVVFD